MKPTMSVYEPLAEVHRLASLIFCASGWPALMAVAACRTLGTRAVLEVLQAERRRSENLGSWASWPRVNATLRALEDPPRGQRRSGRRIDLSTPSIAYRAPQAIAR
jgi:hypothetical protein